MEKRDLIIYANCHGGPLANLLNSSLDFASKYNIKYYVVHKCSEDEIDEMFTKICPQSGVIIKISQMNIEDLNLVP